VDVAETIAFLASDGAAHITDQEVVVSGCAGLAVCPFGKMSRMTARKRRSGRADLSRRGVIRACRRSGGCGGAGSAWITNPLKSDEASTRGVRRCS
jgi:hypothetical protein